MDPKKTTSITDARKRIFEIIEQVQSKGSYFTLTERGKPVAVVVSADEFTAWQETLAAIHDQDVLDELLLSQQHYLDGAYITLDTFLEQAGYIAADKAKSMYGTASIIKTSKKANRTK